MKRRSFLISTASLLASTAAQAQLFKPGDAGVNDKTFGGLRGSFAGTIPPWVLSGATVDLNFADNGYYGGTLATLLSTSRASTGYATNSDGTLTGFAPNTPRIGKGTGLLVEEARINLLTQSQAFDNAGAWNNTDLFQIIPASAVAPDGTNTAYLISDDGNNTVHNLTHSSTAITGSATYTKSMYVKNGTRRFVSIFVTGPAFTNYFYANFDLQLGTVTQSGGIGTGTLATATIMASAGGFWRLVITGVCGAETAVFPGIALLPTGTTLITATYVGTASTVFVWGAQLELGAFATSYIPTTTGSVTRAADVVTLTGAALTTAQGAAVSLVAKAGPTPTNFASLPTILGDNGTQLLLFADTLGRAGIYNGTLLETASEGSPGDFSLNSHKAGSSWLAAGGRSVVNNGGAVQTDALTQVEAGRTLYAGNRSTGDTTWNGYIQRITLWNSRLSDPTLQGLTT